MSWWVSNVSDDMFTSIYRPNSDLDYEPSLTFSNGYGYSNGSPLENYFETSYQVSCTNNDVVWKSIQTLKFWLKYFWLIF